LGDHDAAGTGDAGDIVGEDDAAGAGREADTDEIAADELVLGAEVLEVEAERAAGRREVRREGDGDRAGSGRGDDGGEGSQEGWLGLTGDCAWREEIAGDWGSGVEAEGSGGLVEDIEGGGGAVGGADDIDGGDLRAERRAFGEFDADGAFAELVA
jgi:hypothetical protein